MSSSTLPRRALPRRALSRAASRRVLVPVIVVSLAGALAGGGVLALARNQAVPATAGPTIDASPVAVSAPLPTVQVRTAAAGLAPWDAPLAVTATDGELVDVTATDPDGGVLRGSVRPDGSWQSLSTLVPLAQYGLTATVRDRAGATRTVPAQARTSAAAGVLHAAVSPGDEREVGVGQPVIVRLDRPLHDPAARAALERRLVVTATPAVTGAWRWMSDSEVHYRPESFWATGTKVDVTADLTRLQLTDGIWGSGARSSHFAIGSALISTVDVTAHTMTVTRDGTVLRVLRASMGRTEFPTNGGTHLVLEKNAHRIMNSDTVGLPGAYKTPVDWAVRITNSGTFTHSAPWSVRSQGRVNVSHGCINLSPTDAKWFFDQARRGDVVRVVNASVGPRVSDAGSAEWNRSFAEWKQGSALS